MGLLCAFLLPSLLRCSHSGGSLHTLQFTCVTAGGLPHRRLKAKAAKRLARFKLNSLARPLAAWPAPCWLLDLLDCVYSMGKAQRLARALRGAGLGALTLLLGLWALSGTGGGGRYDSGIDFDGRFEDASGGSYVPFGTVRTEGTRRPLRPLEMCSWETALEVGGHVHRRLGRNACLLMQAWCSQSRLVWEISFLLEDELKPTDVDLTPLPYQNSCSTPLA